MPEGGGIGVTTNSRHWGIRDCEDDFGKGIRPVGVSSV